MNQKTEAIIAQAYALAKFRREIEELKQYSASLLSDYNRMQDSLDAERDQHEKTRNDAEDFERQIEALHKHASALTTEAVNAKSDLKEGLEKAYQNNLKLRHELNKITEDNDALRKERDELKASYAQAFADLQAAASNYDKLLHERDKLIRESNEFKASVVTNDIYSAFDSLKRHCATIEKELETACRERDDLCQSLNGAQSINQALQNDNRHLQSLIDELEAERKTKEVQP